MKVNEHLLQKWCREIASKYWGLNFDIPVKITVLKKSLYACYFFKRGKKWGKVKYLPLNISVNSLHVYKLNSDELYDLMKHEVCHWACQSLGKPFNDGSKHFESELLRIGSCSTRTDFDKEESAVYQRKVAEGSMSRLGDSDFSYIKIDPLRIYKSMYIVYYRQLDIGTLGNWGYGKYRWNPSSPYHDFGRKSWTARKYAAKALLIAYEAENGKISEQREVLLNG